jgi:hypothetical protein
MAIVFVSPKKKQKIFFTAIILASLFFVVAVSLGVFLSKAKKVPISEVFLKPEISIDFSFLSSDLLESLEALSKMQIQFDYQAITEDGKKAAGKISATTIEEAKKLLEGQNLKDIVLEKTKAGRENPFAPYYQAPKGSKNK